MDLFDVLLQTGLITGSLVFYLIFFRKAPTRKGNYWQKGWNFPLKLLCARYAVSRWKRCRGTVPCSDLPRQDLRSGWDELIFRATDSEGAALLLGVRRLLDKQLVELSLFVRLADGTTYRLPRHPDTAVGVWTAVEDGWGCAGFRLQLLEPQLRLRVLYSGLLRRADGTTQHVQLNLIWTSASDTFRHPEDWSSQLAAQALALEPWRDGNWPNMLEGRGDGGWLQWGCVQGRLQASEGSAPDVSTYLKLRGTRERRWDPRGHSALRRDLHITLVATDGTMLQLRGLSYSDVLTQVLSGCVRFPDYRLEPIVSTDLTLPDFCETPDSIPCLYTINVSTASRDVKVILQINKDGGSLLSGVPYGHEEHYRTVGGSIDGYCATGILQAGYEPKVTGSPAVRLAGPARLRWLETAEVEDAVDRCCLPLEQRAARCPALVGGKGASLALLAIEQERLGYQVPPAFCVTTAALTKQLAAYPVLRTALAQVEAAALDYHESDFKDKCHKASELFALTELVSEVGKEVLAHLTELRQKAAQQGLGSESQIRFAVRSSAVGEDSEALSAAGQNDTVLGCSSERAVLDGVRRCWGSMFAFTSAHYRRQNGQACVCGGAVVVQAMVKPRVAGVLFTQLRGSHRALLTANYGLGESVVSGSAEPDTITINRSEDDELSIHSIEVGSKQHRVTSSNEGVFTEEVPESERTKPCLTEDEMLKLARLGINLEEAWASPRDIEWAICKDEIFLLQARPVTSLLGWSAEELLHEFDTPIMADNTLTTFANTGEVMPKPLSPLTLDFVATPMAEQMRGTIGDTLEYKAPCGLTHYRLYIDSFNTLYRRVSKQIDVGLRMMEMTIHGHTVADEHIHAVARHVHPPSLYGWLQQMVTLLKTLFFSRWYMQATIKGIAKLNIHEHQGEDPLELLDAIERALPQISTFCGNHMVTSSASSASQIIAMAILLEGKDDFSPEQCNEIGMMLGGGAAVSAQVPLALGRLARDLASAGLAEEFRAQPPALALDWLRIRAPKLHAEVEDFLCNHGHRAFMEFDLATKPWAMEPEQLVSVLQSMHETKEEQQTLKSDAEIIALLTTPKKPLTRKLLSWLLPLCRRRVEYRESTKAQLVLSLHRVRLAARRLGQRLTARWLLPHPDLVFYFRLAELRRYLRTRDPALLRKASQRRQYYSTWSQLQFPELSTGWVRAGAEEGAGEDAGDEVLRATPVCAGDVTARACVLTDLADIGALQQGDILITRSTDIGWSPYFPLLSGIVTELGGLISHGAVIAREYGLPCVVGAAGATRRFATGDRVRLSGAAGTLQRIAT